MWESLIPQVCDPMDKQVALFINSEKGKGCLRDVLMIVLLDIVLLDRPSCQNQVGVAKYLNQSNERPCRLG